MGAFHFEAVNAKNGQHDVNILCTQSVRLWTTETGKCRKTIWVSQTTSIMAVSYSQGYFACSYGNTVLLYNGTKLVRTFNEHRKRWVDRQSKVLLL